MGKEDNSCETWEEARKWEIRIVNFNWVVVSLIMPLSTSTHIISLSSLSFPLNLCKMDLKENGQSQFIITGCSWSFIGKKDLVQESPAFLPANLLFVSFPWNTKQYREQAGGVCFWTV